MIDTIKKEESIRIYGLYKSLRLSNFIDVMSKGPHCMEYQMDYYKYWLLNLENERNLITKSWKTIEIFNTHINTHYTDGHTLVWRFLVPDDLFYSMDHTFANIDEQSSHQNQLTSHDHYSIGILIIPITLKTPFWHHSYNKFTIFKNKSSTNQYIIP